MIVGCFCQASQGAYWIPIYAPVMPNAFWTAALALAVSFLACCYF